MSLLQRRTPGRSRIRSIPLLLGALLLVPSGAAGQEATLGSEDLTGLRFREVGPANPSGRVTAIAVPEGQTRIIYAGFASSGVWKTVNMGTTWTPIFDDEGSATVGDLAVAPSDPEVVWVGTGERNSLRSNAWGDGVYRSTDGGRSWTHVGLTETREIGRLAIHPDDPSTVYVAALGHLWGANPERGVYRTTDAGESWDRILFVNDTTGFIDLKMAPDDPATLYAASWHRLRWGGGRMEGAGAGSAIWKSTDGGDTWTRLTSPDLDNGLPHAELGRIGLGVTPADPDVIYAVIQSSRSVRRADISTHGGVFRSGDRGATWERVHDISAIPDYYYNEVWVDPSDAERLWLGATFLEESTYGGITFERQRLNNVHVDHHAMWIDPADPEHQVLGNDGGVYITWDDGDTWVHQNIPASQLYEVDVDSTKVPYHVCGGHQDNGTWCGPSRTRERIGITEYDWYSFWGGDGFHSAVAPDDPNWRYGESQYGNMGRMHAGTLKRESLRPHSEDAGSYSGYEFRWDWDTPFVISHHDPTVLYLGGNHLFRLRDRGLEWETLGPDMTQGNRFDPAPDSAHTSYRSLHSVAESTLTRRVLWTGSNDGLIWVSTDAGETWRNVTGNLPQEPPKNCWVGEIEASHHDEATAYVAHDCHRRDDYRPWVFRTTDHGETWTDITGDLPEDGGSYVIREDFENPDLLFVGTQRGVLVSNRGGNEWLRLEGGIPTVAVRDMELMPSEKDLVVGTMGRGVYILDISALQGLTPAVVASRARLFPVEPARQYNQASTYGSHGDFFYSAPNPPYGATIWYWLGEDEGDEVSLRIVRRREGEEEDRVNTLTGPGSRGLHRVQWDLRWQDAPPRRLGEQPGQSQRVDPGTYVVILSVGDETHEEEIEVLEGWVERAPGALR